MALLWAYLLMTIRVVGAGWFWAQPAGDEPDRRDFFTLLARAVGIGLLVNLLAALALASLEAWSPAADWTAWTLLTLAGAVRARRQGRLCGRSLRGLATALALVAAVGAVVVLLPARSEWLAGGWDPGLYQNNAAVIARQHGFQDHTATIYADLPAVEHRLFTESEGLYHETFPAVPLQLESGARPLYFFHLTSLCGAWFHRLGGAGLLFRLPALLGVWCLLLVPGLNGVLGLRGYRRWLGLLPWLVAPLWWYHLAIPTSEMLYLFLWLVCVLLYLPAARQGVRLPWGAALALFAASVNHLSAAALLSVGLLCAAVLERGAGVKHGEERMLAGFGAILLGVWWSLLFADVTVLRLDEKDHILRLILPVAGAGFLLAVGWARYGLAPGRWTRLAPRIAGWAGLLAALVAGVVALGVATEWTRTLSMRAFHQWPLIGPLLVRWSVINSFHGAWYGVWAALGVGLLAWPGRRDDARPAILLQVVVLVCGAIFLLLLISPGIAVLYPWALRRFVVFLVPLCAWAQTAVLLWLAAQPARAWRAGRWAVCLLVLLAAGDGARQSRAAADVGDYRGLYAVLTEINRHLEDTDVVVADDGRWGTPLLLYFDREVINGGLLWQRNDDVYRARVLDILRRIQSEQGCRIVWLTSLPKGMEVYPFDIGPVAPLLEGVAFEYRTVVHSSRGRSFAERSNQRTFALHVWLEE